MTSHWDISLETFRLSLKLTFDLLNFSQLKVVTIQHHPLCVTVQLSSNDLDLISRNWSDSNALRLKGWISFMQLTPACVHYYLFVYFCCFYPPYFSQGWSQPEPANHIWGRTERQRGRGVGWGVGGQLDSKWEMIFPLRMTEKKERWEREREREGRTEAFKAINAS